MPLTTKVGGWRRAVTTRVWRGRQGARRSQTCARGYGRCERIRRHQARASCWPPMLKPTRRRACHSSAPQRGAPTLGRRREAWRRGSVGPARRRASGAIRRSRPSHPVLAQAQVPAARSHQTTRRRRPAAGPPDRTVDLALAAAAESAVVEGAGGAAGAGAGVGNGAVGARVGAST